MKKIILIVMFVFVGSAGYANPLQFMWQNENDKWSTQDTILQILVISSIFIDMTQTNYGLENGCTEENPILGGHPSKLKFYTYNISAMSLHTITAYILPKKYRTILQSVYLGIETGVILSNYYTVGRFKLKF